MLAKRLYRPCIWFVAATAAFDLLATIFALNGGWLEEANPIARAVLDRLSVEGLVIFRVACTTIGCLALALTIRLCARRGRPATALLLIAGVLAGHAVLIWHWIRCLAVMQL